MKLWIWNFIWFRQYFYILLKLRIWKNVYLIYYNFIDELLFIGRYKFEKWIILRICEEIWLLKLNEFWKLRNEYIDPNYYIWNIMDYYAIDKLWNFDWMRNWWFVKLWKLWIYGKVIKVDSENPGLDFCIINPVVFIKSWVEKYVLYLWF